MTQKHFVLSKSAVLLLVDGLVYKANTAKNLQRLRSVDQMIWNVHFI